MTITDQEIRAALAPLRDDEPSRAEINAVLLRAERRRTRHPWRVPAIVAVTACAAALAAFALLPSSEQPTGDSRSSVVGAFLAASAHAAEPPVRADYRYTRIRVRIDEPNVDASRCKLPPRPTTPEEANAVQEEVARELANCQTIRGRDVREFVNEQWVDKRLKGRLKAGPMRVVSGTDAPRTVAPGHAGQFMFGDVLIADTNGTAAADFDALPTDPAALEARLADLALRGFDPRIAARTRDYQVVQAALALLTYPKLSAALRAAAFGVLARIPGFRDEGVDTDELGRRGHRVELTAASNPLGPSRLSVLFDSDHAELLSWSETTTAGEYRHTRTTLIEQAAYVPTTDSRP